MLTRAGWIALVASVVTIIGGRVLGLAELYLLGAVGVALCILAVVQVRRVPALVVERVLVPRRVHVGTSSRVELRVRNTGRRRTPVLTLFEPVEGTIGAQVSIAPLGAGQQYGASYRLPTERRGLLGVGPLECRRVDPFGLARKRSVVADATHLTVLPTVHPLDGMPPTGGLDDPLAGAVRPVLSSIAAGDFAALRPYVPGDDLRRVHWASSARIGDLLVRQDDPPWQGHLTVLLDGRDDRITADRFEFAVSVAASVLLQVGLAGDRTRLVVTDGLDTGLVDARSASDQLLERLATVQRHPSAGPLPLAPGDGRRHTGTLVVIAGRINDDDLRRLRARRTEFSEVIVLSLHAPVPSGGSDLRVLSIPERAAVPATWRQVVEA